MKLKLAIRKVGEWDRLAILDEDGRELPAIRGIKIDPRPGQEPVITVEFTAGEDFDISGLPRPKPITYKYIEPE